MTPESLSVGLTALNLSIFGLCVFALFKPAATLPAAWKPTRLKAASVYFIFWVGSAVAGGIVFAAVHERAMRTDPVYRARVEKREQEEAERLAARKAERDAELIEEAKRAAAEEQQKRIENWESDRGKISALTMSNEFVEDRLKAPRTAKFAWYSESQVSHLGNGKFRVLSYVDAQNSFGALIRTHYACTLQDNGDNQWTLIDLTME